MRLKVKPLGIEAGGKPIVVLDDIIAEALGIHSLDRVKLIHEESHILAIVNIAHDFPVDVIGVYEAVRKRLHLYEGDEIEVARAERPKSLNYIREKILGRRLSCSKINMIVMDVVERHLSDVEMASFITALHIRGMSLDESEALTRAMVETGEKLKLGDEPILDKHSIGGIPGDKTTILVVPTVASAGFTIPKASSRAITSPAGTADRVEALCPVDLSLEEIREVVAETNGCMVWGGTLNLAPADDIFIQVEYSLSIDPLLLPSIMSKKKAMGSKYLVVDIPTGRGAKVKTIGEAHELASDFIELGRRLGIQVECASTFGEQPLGYAIGPALEAREALSALMGQEVGDLKDKAASLAGILLEMVGVEEGRDEALRIMTSGKAEKKLREIIEAQGGDPKVRPEDIEIGDRVSAIRSERDGRVLWINNENIADVARVAGAPKDKGAGVLLRKKMGDSVRSGDVIFEVYAENNSKLESATVLAEDLSPIGVGRRFEENMLMDRIAAKKVHERSFILER
jgi:AMP phosphorylase